MSAQPLARQTNSSTTPKCSQASSTIADLRALAMWEQQRRDDLYQRSRSLVKPEENGKRVAKLRFQGRLAAMALVTLESQIPPCGGKKGHITVFSRASRKRLMTLFHTLEPRGLPIFLTLTYPDEFPQARVAKAHLRAFLERIRRRFPRSSAIWRLEFQHRGAPHFHLILFDLPWISRDEIQHMWGEIIGYSDVHVWIQAMHSIKRLMYYVSKYIAKHTPREDGCFNSLTYPHGVGRYWGIFQRHNLPFAERVEFVWPLEQGWQWAVVDRFRQCAVGKYPPIAEYLCPGFTLYVEDARLWRDVFEMCQCLKF